MQKPSIPKGTRDFSPNEMVKREYIFSSIREVFKKYGYAPIETPAMENLSTLLGKYGEEGDKLLFKILNSGDFLGTTDTYTPEKENSASLAMKICKKGLRYDLTVPFARYVVQHQNEITFPFKRYQIQPVWRADRPQKGRYQEFYQCDADVVGSNSLVNELELVQIIEEVFARLNIQVTIKLNNRKLLAGIAEIIGEPGKLTDITVAVDKIDKIGLDMVKTELISNGLSGPTVQKLKPFLEMKGTNKEIMGQMHKLMLSSAVGMKGLEEMECLMGLINSYCSPAKVEFDLTLARGLNYYTGAIIEVKANDVEIGSICGGGRYDDLTGIFGLKDVSGVGISFGADRIFDVLNQLNTYPESVNAASKILLVNFGAKEEPCCLKILKSIRRAGVSAEFFPDASKLKKQMAYADSKNIPFVLLIGEEEIKSGNYTLKNMTTGEQEVLTEGQIIEKLQ